MKTNNVHVECWMPIPGFEKYEASFDGEIRSLWKPEPRILKAYDTGGKGKSTTVSVTLIQDGKRNQCQVSHLVYMAFYGDIPEGHVIAHRNQLLHDNSVPNIYATTLSALAAKLNHTTHNRPVLKLNPAGEIVEIYRSAREAAKKNNYEAHTIAYRCNGKATQVAAGGFDYAYEDSDDSIRWAQERLAREREKTELSVRAEREEEMW